MSELTVYNQNMKPSISALRAVTATLFRRYFLWGIAIVGVLLLVAYGLVFWAMSTNPWWALCLIVLIPATIIAALLVVVLRWSLARLMPRPLTKSERAQIVQFTDDVAGIIETGRTPLPLLAAKLAFDVVRRKESTLLTKTISQSSSLKSSFESIRRLFEK